VELGRYDMLMGGGETRGDSSPPLRHHANYKRDFGLPPESLFFGKIAKVGEKWLVGFSNSY
jgi:hypothetical protein